jgi:diguanylate cyclase (GGDEF)-like protein
VDQAGTGDLDFAGINTNLLLRYVHDELGDDSVARLLRSANETRSAEQLLDAGSWSSYDQFRRLLTAAAANFGGNEILTNAAGSGLDDPTMPELTALLQSLGSPEALLGMLTEGGGASLVPIISLAGEVVSENEWLVHIAFDATFEPFREFCAWSAGLLTSIPKLFAFRADVSEEACACDGHPACTYRVRWLPADTETQLAALEQNNQLLAARLASLQETVGDLVSGDDIETVLERVIASVAGALHAATFVLALDDLDAERALYWSGATEEAAAEIAREIRETSRSDDPSRLVVDVTSRRRRYGSLAATNPGASFFPQERLVLQAHARLAAAALDSAAALSEARREAETSRVLLNLSTALAAISSSDDVATTIAKAVPTVIDCDRSAVVLFDHAARVGRAVATYGYTPAQDVRLRSINVPIPAPRAGDSGVLVFDRDAAANHKMLSMLMHEVNATAIARVPIIIDDVHVGLIVGDVTGDPARLTSGSKLQERLRGLASQASIAIRNARLLDEIRHQALHDALTGLPNRTLILDRAQQVLARARREGNQCGILFVDLDSFKQVNDTFGHEIGDRLLQAVAARFMTSFRECDTIGRLGGDEFVVVIEVSSPLAAPEHVAERIKEALREPFELDDDVPAITMTASIGIAVGDRYSATNLLRDADIALYEAKAAGRDCHVRFQRAMQTAVEDRLALELDLRAAILRDEFFLMYQPIFELETGETLGVEALIRWTHPHRGLVQPDDFIPLLEETKLMIEVGRWVLRQACEQAVAMQLPERGLYVSVNVSARQLDDTQFPQDVADALDDSGLPPSALVLEVTETAIMRDPTASAYRLTKIKELGVNLAIDDFGTGHSSLGYLQQFPIDILKIDRSFIAGMQDSPDSAALVRTLVSLGRQLGLQTLAEGVEQQEQAARLQAEQCHSAQGFLFARPLTCEALVDVLDMRCALPDARAGGDQES